MTYDVYVNDEISRAVVSADYVRRRIEAAVAERLERGAESAADVVLDVYVNSLGGDVAEALQIMQVLRDAECKTVAHVYGLTASAATIVMLGCTEVRISRYASLMVHNCWQSQDIFGGYNAEQLRELIRELEKDARTMEAVDALVLKIYEDSTGASREVLCEMMKDEAWMSAERAVELGFADRLEDAEDDDLSAPPFTGHLRARLEARRLPVPEDRADGAEGTDSPDNPDFPETPGATQEGQETDSETQEADSETQEADSEEQEAETPSEEQEAETPSEADALRGEVAELRAQIEAMRRMPAEDTLSIEGDGGGAARSAFGNAREAYARVFGRG